MKKRIVLCLLALALLAGTVPMASAASADLTYDVDEDSGVWQDADPLTVTLWHVCGGEVDSPLNSLIEQFNSTIGAEQNIRVKVELVSNSSSIHKSVLPPPTVTQAPLPCRICSCPTPKRCWPSRTRT